MFDHVSIRVADRDRSERFYDTVLSQLAVDQSYRTESFTEWQDFLITGVGPGEHPTRRLHVGFVAPSRGHVDGFWKAGTGAGFADDGAPGPRPEYGGDYYGGFLRDPDGNSAEGVHDGDLRRGGIIDHVWIRVADLSQAGAFYETIAPFAGFRLDGRWPDRIQFRGSTGSFSILSGPPTEHLHMAFPAAEDRLVDEFHAAAVGAGYVSNGSPGERPRYHPGYYAAYVLDPDGNNIEVVNHHR